MAGNLYAFGCSHTAGHALKSELSIDFLKKYYKKQCNVKDYKELNSKYNEIAREKIIHKFNKVLGDKVDYPENSYAAHLGKLLSLKVKNYAQSGTGIDTVYKQFEKQLENINWKTDIVVIELPPIHRYKSEDSNVIYGLHYNRTTSKFMPNVESMECFYAGVISMLAKYPVKFINVMNDRHEDIKKYIDLVPANTQSLMDLCEEQNMPRYPTGHFWHESHKLFAEEIGKKL